MKHVSANCLILISFSVQAEASERTICYCSRCSRKPIVCLAGDWPLRNCDSNAFTTQSFSSMLSPFCVTLPKGCEMPTSKKRALVSLYGYVCCVSKAQVKKIDVTGIPRLAMRVLLRGGLIVCCPTLKGAMGRLMLFLKGINVGV